MEYEELSDTELLARYRFSRSSIEYIATLIAEDVEPSTARNHSLSSTEELLVTLRYFATGSFMQVIGDTFGYDKATVSRAVRRVSLALAAKAADFIKWPDTPNEVNENKRGFYQLANFPCVLGCIDGTHVRILAPTDNEPNYVNRKGTHSINVQVITDECTDDKWTKSPEKDQNTFGYFCYINIEWVYNSHLQKNRKKCTQ